MHFAQRDGPFTRDNPAACRGSPGVTALPFHASFAAAIQDHPEIVRKVEQRWALARVLKLMQVRS
jgi:hypothetical protein